MWLHMRLLENCNLKCKHCYALDRSRTGVMDFKIFKESIDIYSNKIRKRSIDLDKRVMLSGGEPFLYDQFKAALEYTYNKSDITRISILTNGILVPDFIYFLSKYKDRLRIQISIEGGRSLDNEIRGKGHFEKAVKSLGLLKEKKFDFHISYTISKHNMGEYKKIINLARAFDSKKNNMSPYIGEPENMLSFEEWEGFKKKVRMYAGKVNHVPVASPRCCGWTYNCGAFLGGLTVNPDGSLTGCARDNRVVGSYADIENYYINHGYFMHSTCMRNKWTGESDLERIYQVEEKRRKKITAQANLIKL